MAGVVEQVERRHRKRRGRGDVVEEKKWRRWVDLRGRDSTVDADIVQVFSVERFSESRLSTEASISSLSAPFLAALCGAFTFGDTGERGIDTSTRKGTHGFDGESVVGSIHGQAGCKIVARLSERVEMSGQGTRVKVLELRQQ